MVHSSGEGGWRGISAMKDWRKAWAETKEWAAAPEVCMVLSIKLKGALDLDLTLSKAAAKESSALGAAKEGVPTGWAQKKMESEYNVGDVHSGKRMSSVGNEDASVHCQDTPFPLLWHKGDKQMR